jgi:hypothetical protein
MATRNAEGIVPSLNIQVDSNHPDTPSVRQLYMELEPLYGPAGLVRLKVNLEVKPGTGAKPRFVASELIETCRPCF